MIYCFDLDGTLAIDIRGEYEGSLPLEKRIAKVNALYDAGHTIKIFTARGATTGIGWHNFTARQLQGWGLKYHELINGKPHADIYIDDKAVNAARWFDDLQS